MFPLIGSRRIADTLLELADAVLRPLPADDTSRAVAAPERSGRQDARGATTPHPHRQPVRIAHARRSGTPAPPTHHCTCPLPARTAVTRPAPSRT